MNHVCQEPSLTANHIFDANGRRQTVDNLITGKMSKIWLRSVANELGRLVNGIPNRVRGTNCVVFVPKSKVPKNKKVTYANMVCDYRPAINSTMKKKLPHQLQIYWRPNFY